jgi:hypothetical protein
MYKPTLTEAVQTDLSSPKPNRGKRLALRFAALVLAVSALGAAYWFTRPPELVWWRSEAIGKTGRHVHVLIPQGWSKQMEAFPAIREWQEWEFGAWEDRRPRFLRWLLPDAREHGELSIIITPSRLLARVDSKIIRLDAASKLKANKAVTLADGQILEGVFYQRTNLPAFNRTYRQICNSLRIE